MEQLKAKEKANITKILFIVITTGIAIVLISFTVGRELYEGRSHNLFSFGLIHFSGYLFFLLMPVEMAFIYYLSWFGEIQLISVAVATAVVAQIIDYVIGLLVSSKKILSFMSRKRILKAEKYIRKYGNLTIFLFNLLPLSSPVIALVAGMLRLKFKDLMLYSITGLFIKYLILSLIF